MANSPGLDEITTTTLRSRPMKKDWNDKDAVKVAQSGTPVPEKDFSPKTKEEGAAGPQNDTAPFPAKGPVAKANSTPVPSKQAHGYGHPASAKSGALRCSGHSGAHQVGKKRK